MRLTNAANHARWRALEGDEYGRAKAARLALAQEAAEKVIGPFGPAIEVVDSFTPLTIERFTRKDQGAVYGSPRKISDGRTPWSNLFLAGTDQGFLGIVGSMLSGVTMVNRHLLT